jgi:hypothetical protein
MRVISSAMAMRSAIDGDLVSMVRAFAGGDLEAARAAAGRAANSGDPVARVAAEYLAGVIARGSRPAYEHAEAFSAFIRGGGNRQLYRAEHEALRGIYRELAPGFRVVDAGVGDGLAVLPAIEGIDAALTVIEPARELLSATVGGLERMGVRYEAFAMTIEAFIRAHGDRRFDLIQATFSLQSVPRDTRRRVLAWMQRASPRLAIAEFDVPRFANLLDPAHVAHVVERYRRGLAEYRDDGGLVAQGFLMPVMFGYFTTGRARTNDEQPMADWASDLRDAGFAEVATSVIADYWWAPAFLALARQTPRAGA